jgi:diguanylate cyclase (GGDEF)-like protein/PAS domain S-box-containing protein
MRCYIVEALGLWLMINKEKILVVDDSWQVVDLIAGKFLPSLGYKALTASTGRRAIEIVKSSPLALLLLDMRLPDMNGLDVLRQLSSEGYNVPTILITAHGSEQVATDAFRLGVQDYLTKPIDIEALSVAINRALNKARLEREKTNLTRQLQEQVTWLTVLSKVGRSVTSTLELDEVLRRIVEAGVRLTRAEEGFLALLDEDNRQLFLRAAKNIDQVKVNTMRILVTDDIMARVIATSSPWRSSAANAKTPLKISTGYLVLSLMYVPIVSKGKVLGVLSVDNRILHQEFSQTDENLLTSLADYAAIALENAGLYERAQLEIGERKRIELALRESEERYALAVQGANDGLWDWNLKTNQIYYSPRWKAMLGFRETDLESKWEEWFGRIHPEDKDRVKLDIGTHIKGITPHFYSEHRILHKDGVYRWMLARGVAVRDAQNQAYRLAGSLSDIDDRKKAEEKLLRNAFYDTLTDLPNRALFLDRLSQAVERSKRRPDYSFTVLLMDLDHFKDVNDNLGHLVGDQLLVSIAGMLRKGFRTTDTVARYGGDEFVILLEDVSSQDDATRIAGWVQTKLTHPFTLDGNEVYINASIGIVMSTNGYERAEDVLRDADIALYSAKAAGRARHVVFDPSIRTRVMDRITLESEIRQALEHNEFQVYYQPIISLTSGEITGLEALVRWAHPERGLLNPASFLPLAEETGLIIQIDQWVLQEACRQLRAWQKRFPTTRNLTISVNFSGKEVSQPDFTERIEKILQDTGLDPECLKLEMTENVIMRGSEENLAIFTRLQSLGVKTQIDDFGVGYSSLSYLSQFPIEALKIDQAFIDQMINDNNQMKIVQTIVALTARLGIDVIAEGVETAQQLTLLKKLGCQYGQGFLISVPLEAGAVEELLASLKARADQKAAQTEITGPTAEGPPATSAGPEDSTAEIPSDQTEPETLPAELASPEDNATTPSEPAREVDSNLPEDTPPVESSAE